MKRVENHETFVRFLFAKADKFKESVLSSQCAIEVESIYLSHVLLDILRYVDNEKEGKSEG